MNTFNKTLWSEGMFLAPHHFQLWDQYYERLLSHRLQHLQPFGWGVGELSIDTNSLGNGNFAVDSLQAVLPDGLVLSVPDQGPLPESRVVDKWFSSSLEHLDVLIGVPRDQTGAANCQIDKSPSSLPTRYTAEYVKVPDHNTGENMREIAVAQTNLKILFATEETSSYTTIKIAEIVRVSKGSFALRQNYIPPCLAINSSQYLLKLTRGLLDTLLAKRNSLFAYQQVPDDSANVDVKQFCLLLAINTLLPQLSHILEKGKAHPEMLYVSLAGFAGQLTVFVKELDQKDIPAYSHTDLTGTFCDLEMKIRLALESLTATRYVEIPLARFKDNVLHGEIVDDELLKGAAFYLAAHGDLSEDQLRDLVPKRIKIGAVKDLDVIVSRALPGVRLSHVPHPPPTLPLDIGHQYFLLETEGEFWASVCQSHSVALNVSSNLKSVQLELLATKT